MNVFRRFFSAHKPLPAVEVVAIEKKHVAEEFSTYFDDKNREYLDTDFKEYINTRYPEYVKNNYDFIDPDGYPEKERPVYGLALSGGGIRSASFGIGVIQALNNSGFTKPDKPTIFSKLSYLSTVSGGGYTGAALSWFMRCWGLFPFGDLSSFNGSKQTEKNENKILNYIRQHGNYLTPPGLGTISLVASVLSSALHSLLAYSLLLSVAMYILISVVLSGFISHLLELQWEAMPIFHSLLEHISNIIAVSDSNTVGYNPNRIKFSLLFIDLASISIFFFLLTSLFYGFSSVITALISSQYGYRVRVQKMLGFWMKAAIACLLLSLLPTVVVMLSGAKFELSDPVFWGSGGAGLAAIIMSILEFKRRFDNAENGSSWIGNVIEMAIVASFVFFIVAFTYLVGEMLYDLSLQDHISRPLGVGPYWYLGIALGLAILVNINQISPHKMYRDRLMDTFLRNPEISPLGSLSKKGLLANRTLLTDLADTPHWAPYHLINCNVILNNAREARYQGRLGDSFLLSPHYCGSDATHYIQTDKLALGKLTLATAMSISGAAANPHAGVGGLGGSTKPYVSFLMTFFGFRLGYWVNNPGSWYGRIKPFLRPNYLFPGTSSLFDFGHNESSSYIELSDGGHFENTGLYELIRRRVPVIILSDGSADETTNFTDFGNAVARIRIDFGVSIRFNDAHFDLSGMIPDSQAVIAEVEGQARKIYDEKYHLSERGYAIADIVYPQLDDQNAFIGKLVYIKASMTRNLTGDIYAYRSENPQFPNQPTLDQFFDERQFESYRELGYQLTKQFLQDENALKQLP